ncbi:hypothetical protein J3A83DRAFT_4095574, partial [Scleroderma citrinum]
ACKNASIERFHYLGCPMHRILKGFVVQGGDITRDESIYGGKFNNERQGPTIVALLEWPTCATTLTHPSSLL